jgi:hypothetical protein
VSIQGGVHFDLLKRVLRDISRSGQNPEEIIDQVSATVFPMFRVRISSLPHTLSERLLLVVTFASDLVSHQLHTGMTFTPFEPAGPRVSADIY